MWGEREEEEEEAEPILTIFNHRGGNGEDQGQQHPEVPNPALAPTHPPAPCQDWWVWGRVGRGRVLERGQMCEAAGFGAILFQ